MDHATNKTDKEDKRISIAIMSSFAILTIQYFILVFFNLMGTGIGSVVQFISKIIVGMLYLVSLPPVLKRNKIKFIGTYLIAIFIFILNYTMFNKNWIYLKSIIFPLFFTCLPSFIYAYSISNWDIFIGIMKKTRNIVFIVGTAVGILVFSGTSSVGSYSMSLSYYMLLPAIMFIDEFIEKKNFKSAVPLTIALMVILALGSRGAIMCFGVFTLLKVLRRIKDISYTKVLLYIILFSLIILGIILFDEILKFIYDTLLSYGIESRTIRLFLRGGVNLSGRDTIYKLILDEVFKKPFIGLGLAGDRTILDDNNSYAHNIFIEIFADFGIVLGTIINIILLFIVTKTLFLKDNRLYNLLIIWISIGFIPLLVSGSYLTDFKFWILLGICTHVYHDSN